MNFALSIRRLSEFLAGCSVHGVYATPVFPSVQFRPLDTVVQAIQLSPCQPVLAAASWLTSFAALRFTAMLCSQLGSSAC